MTSKPSIFRLFFIGLFANLLAFTPYPNCIAIETNIPDLGQHTQSILSTSTEQLMGDAIMRKIYGTDCVIFDPVVSEYLTQLAAKFTQHANIKDYPLHFFGLNTAEINAFAFFGGHIAVHGGLMLMVENESELAAVLAHETSHISQHHLARILESNKQRAPITIAEVLAAAAIGALGAPEAGAHLATAALAGHVQHLINFTREHEYEADRMGMNLLAKMNYDPKAMASVFERLKQSSIYSDKPPEYLMTHPVFEARIADAQNRAASLPQHKPTDNLLFYLARARIESTYDEKNNNNNIKRFKVKLAKMNANTGVNNVNRVAAEYGYALTLVKSHRQKENKEGLEILKRLVNEHPNEWALELGLIEAEAMTGTYDSVQKFKQLHEKYPRNFGLTLSYVNILLQNGKAKEALYLLKLQRRDNFNNPIIHQFLAQAHSITHQHTEVHRAQAEWHFARGEEKETEKQLELALERAEHNPETQKLIKDRHERIKEIIKEQKSL